MAIPSKTQSARISNAKNGFNKDTIPRYLSGRTDFQIELTKRIDNYFRTTGARKNGGVYISVKTILIFLLYTISYGLLLSNWFNPNGILFCAFLFGAANVLIVFNIAHDASHNALFKNKLLNKILSYSFNLVGTDAYLWDLTHNKIHHVYPNVGDYDSDIEQQAPFIRISPTVQWRPFHRWQLYYAPLLYMTYSIFLIFLKDLRVCGLLPGKESELLSKKAPKKQIALLLVSKAIYFTITIVIPYLVIDVSTSQFVLGYLAAHIFVGILLSSVLIPVHMVDEAPFAVVDKSGRIEDNWAMHVLKNTTDYARKSKLANLLFGGLNTHLVHHLFPSVSHANYIAMSQILKETSQDFNLSYHEVSMAGAIKSHFRLLKRMSKKTP